MFGFWCHWLFYPFVVPVGYDYRDVKLFLYVNFPRNAREYTISFSDVKNCHRQLLYSAQNVSEFRAMYLIPAQLARFEKEGRSGYGAQ